MIKNIGCSGDAKFGVGWPLGRDGRSAGNHVISHASGSHNRVDQRREKRVINYTFLL